MIYHITFHLITLLFIAVCIKLSRRRYWYSGPLQKECPKGSREYDKAVSQGFRPVAERRRDMMLMELKPGYEVLLDAD